MKKKMVMALLAMSMSITQIPKIPVMAQRSIPVEENTVENSGGGY